MSHIQNFMSSVPRWLLILIVFSVLMLLGYAVLDSRAIEIPVEKKSPGTGQDSSKPAVPKFGNIEIISAFIESINIPILVYEKTDGDLKIISANQAAADFYVAQQDQLIGKRPEDLHVMIKPWIKNFREWAAEQIERISWANQKRDKPFGKTKIPMDLTFRHPHFTGKWYLTSNYLNLKDEKFIVTRYSRVEGDP